MRELRSTGNAFFWFALFLLGYALVVPPPEGTGHGKRPRFLRMVIEESGTPGHTEKVNITVPWFLFRSGLHAVSAGKLEREANLHFDDTVAAEIVRDAWKELSEKPEGTDVVKVHDDGEITFRKEKGEIHLTVKEGAGARRRAAAGDRHDPLPRPLHGGRRFRRPRPRHRGPLRGDEAGLARRRHRGDERRRPREGRHRLKCPGGTRTAGSPEPPPR